MRRLVRREAGDPHDLDQRGGGYGLDRYLHENSVTARPRPLGAVTNPRRAGRRRRPQRLPAAAHTRPHRTVLVNRRPSPPSPPSRSGRHESVHERVLRLVLADARLGTPVRSTGPPARWSCSSTFASSPLSRRRRRRSSTRSRRAGRGTGCSATRSCSSRSAGVGMNFTWFASAYDTDDVPYRFADADSDHLPWSWPRGPPRRWSTGTSPSSRYVVMRLAMVSQWLRAACTDRERRRSALRTP